MGGGRGKTVYISEGLTDFSKARPSALWSHANTAGTSMGHSYLQDRRQRQAPLKLKGLAGSLLRKNSKNPAQLEATSGHQKEKAGPIPGHQASFSPMLATPPAGASISSPGGWLGCPVWKLTAELRDRPPARASTQLLLTCHGPRRARLC